MKRDVLHGLRSALLLSLWLLLTQVLSAILSAVVILLLGISHPVGPTPLWQWVVSGVLICLLWLGMGMAAPAFVQLHPAGTVLLLTAWALLSSWMRNAYLLFLPQSTCGGMLRNMVQVLVHSSGSLLDEYRDLPVGCFVLSAAFGVGLLFRRRPAAAAMEENGIGT